MESSLAVEGVEQKAIAITSLTSWQTAVEATKERWTEEGMNASSIAAVSPSRVGSGTQTELEMAQKALDELEDIVEIDPKYRSRIIAMVAEIKAERQQHIVGRTVATEVRSQLPVPLRRASSTRKTMAADHSAKGGAKRGRPRKDTS